MSWFDAFDHNAQIQRYGTQSFFKREFYTEFEKISKYPNSRIVLRDGCVIALPLPYAYRNSFNDIARMIYVMCPLKLYYYTQDSQYNTHTIWADWRQYMPGKWVLNLFPVQHDDMNQKPILSDMLYDNNINEFIIPKRTESWIDDLMEYLRPGYNTGIQNTEKQLRKDYKRRLKMLEAIVLQRGY